jgi:glucosamine kinase
MILIADSGSTKCEWGLITEQGINSSVITSGINPFFQGTENIAEILRSEFTASKEFDAIYFYGAGCINQEKQNIVKKALSEVFKAGEIFIGSDLLAAARSLCQDQPGIACILGTGSNSCYYDGSEILNHVSPLGFILGDEGSGAELGKNLLGDILKNQLPPVIINDFFKAYPVSAAEILENVYKRPFPSRYLAGYARFLSENIHYPEIEQLVISGFRKFVIRNLLQYTAIKNTDIHFTGGIAFHFEAQLRKVIDQQHLQLGKIERAPMNGLIRYHLKMKLK